MPLELVTGPANASKAGVVLGSFRKEAEAGNAPVLVVPTTADRDVYEAELLEGGALIGGKVVTWERFVRDLARRTAVEGRVVGPIRRGLIVREIVRGALSEGRLVELASSAQAPGFPEALERLVLEHSRALMTDQQLHDLPAGGSTRRAGETVSLVRDYFNHLDSEGILDRDLQARLALDALRKDPALWSGEPVLLYGFADLTALQAATVAALAACADVTVSLPTEVHRPVGVADIAIARLDAAGAGVGAPINCEPESPNGAIELIAAELFADAEGGSITDHHGVDIATASGTRATAELAVGKVLDHIASGIPADRVVIVRADAGADPLLEGLLRDAGVSVARPESALFAATTLGRAIASLCRAAFDPQNATADDGLAWVRAAAGPHAIATVDSIEADVRVRGLSKAKDVLVRWKDAGGSLEPLDALRKVTNSADFADVLAGAADELMQAALEKQGVRMKRDSLFDASVVSAVTKAGNDLWDILDRDDASAMLSELSALQVDIDTGAPRPNAVQFTDSSSIRARTVDAIVVLGLEQGVFPAAPPPDPFLGDTPADSLGELALNESDDSRWGSAAARHGAGERERFIACFARARKAVSLVVRVADDGGGEVASSVFLDEVLRLFGLELGSVEHRPAGSVAPASQSSPERASLRATALSLSGSNPPQLPEELSKAARQCVEDEYESVVSPSRLEAYCECPISWLGGNVLDPEDMEPEGEPTFRGTTVHLALQKAIQVAIDEGDGTVSEGIMDSARSAIREAIKERSVEAADTLAAKVALQRSETMAMQWLDAELAREWKVPAKHLEFEFGGKDIAPLDLGDGIQLRGTVDRIDILGGGEEPRLVVRDYKSGGSIWAQAAWENKRRLQAPLYLLAAIQLLGGKPAGAFYDSVKTRKLRGAIVDGTPGAGSLTSTDVVTEEELQALINSAKERARSAVRGIRKGFLSSDPDHCSGGYGCRYPWLCRPDR